MQIGTEQRKFVFVAIDDHKRPGYYIHSNGSIQKVTENYTKVSEPVFITSQELSDLLSRPKSGFSKSLLVRRCEPLFTKRSRYPAPDSKKPILVDDEQARYTLGQVVQDISYQ